LAHDVHIWLVHLDGDPTWLDHGQSSLSVGEQDRAAKFKFERDRRRYIIAHVALRSILAGYLDVNPSDLDYALGPNGKPDLSDRVGARGVRFNLSHSGAAALIAVTADREIGVDIEYVKKDFPIHEVAERFFTRQEIAALKQLPEHLHSEAFFKCWTSKEAYLKAKGTGLSGKLDEVEIHLTPEQTVQVKGRIPDWTLREVAVDKEYIAALVVAGDECPIARYRWQPPGNDSGRRHD
jgi:4'-phosphopantetheinyl transferase